MTDSEAELREILDIKKELGKRLAIAAHHYQKPEVIGLADFVGDSYMLAVEAASRDAEFIIFCGVRFMAESAAVLARPGQNVLIPDMDAGCPMANMIDAASAGPVLENLDAITASTVIPVTYMNSYADMKALTGNRGGAVCTSSNARKIVSLCLEKGPVFFSPDRNLGINTANVLGLERKRIFTVKKDGQLVSEAGLPGGAEDGLLFLWDGNCHVHKRFSPGDLEKARAQDGGVKIIVHPECDEDVVNNADMSGSTEYIWNTVKDGPSGSSWCIGTEASFVYRLARSFPDKKILPLRESFCQDMSRIDIHNILNSLRAIRDLKAGEEDRLPGLVTVSDEVRTNAALSLRRMIDGVNA